MSVEQGWVAQTLKPVLAGTKWPAAADKATVRLETGRQLTYANEILVYSGDCSKQPHCAGYETDLVVIDQYAGDEWIPRVVIECKYGAVTTHDALTYSAKALSHKNVHPYLRYGILVGNFGGPLPGRLIRHGANFDFMMTWKSAEPMPSERAALQEVVAQELDASRKLHTLLSEKHPLERFVVLHRRLCLRSASPPDSEGCQA